jgi:hypothetical protein
MKIVALLAATAATASAASRTISGSASKTLISKARKLEDADEAEEEEYAFLMNYKLKLRSCVAGEAIKDPETGEYEYNAVVFRLCPDNGDCDDESQDGCKEGYGDYIVGLNSFVQEYMEAERENMQYDDNFNAAEYAECREYENENNDDGNGAVYYVGPACTEDGTDIKLDMFYDEACTTKPEDVTFEDVSNGWTLPYSDGGLISTYCNSCTEYNDNGEYEAKEFCQKLYEDANKCETNMETYHYYGKQEGACEYIQELLPARKSGGGAGKVVGWLFFICVIGAFAGYVVWWKKKKAAGGNAGDGLMA